MHTHWRDCQEWKSEGLRLTTASNEAAKLFDAAVTQYVGFYQDTEFGGMDGTLDSIFKADPDFVMGRVISNAGSLIGMAKTPRLNRSLKESLETMSRLADSQTLTLREKLHVEAVEQLSSGQIDKACATWEQILVDHPTDVLALRLAQDGYFHLGHPVELRDCTARVLPEWSPSLPLYSYVLGMYSFGLEESGDYEKAEKMARRALELNRRDSWSTHAVAHVLEMTGRFDEGLKFLDDTRNDWQPHSKLKCHISWHSALFHIERAEYEEALDIFDNTVSSVAKQNQSPANFADACSLLYRLSLEGLDVGSWWQALCDLCLVHLDDHLSTFYDVHYMMAFLGANDLQAANNFVNAARKFVSTGEGYNSRVLQDVGLPLLESLIAYNKKDFESVVEVLLPLKYHITDGNVGGSRAQKDVMMQLLIHAAVNSTRPRHRVIARRLLSEKKALKNNSPLTDRLVAKLSS